MLSRWTPVPLLACTVALAACSGGAITAQPVVQTQAPQQTVVADQTQPLESVPAPDATSMAGRSTTSQPAAAPESAAVKPADTAKPAETAQPADTAKPAAVVAFRPGTTGKRVPVPAEGRAVDTRRPTRVIGNGTPASCTSTAVVAAVAKGGIITFKCGPKPVFITMTATAKVRNTSARVVIDGGGLVTLSGGKKRRILYQNTCDPKQVFTTPHCQDQATPSLVVQNITFTGGNATGEKAEGGGGGAIFVRGGRLKIVNSRFIDSRCDATGPDLGGAAVRVLSQYRGLPVYVVNSTFGGIKGRGGACSNGGGLSSIGVSWTILNSLFQYNSAIGRGANPAKPGTPGGGSGGAIYADGDEMTMRIAGTIITNNAAREGGGAVFFVSNNRTGTLRIEDSSFSRNHSGAFETAGYKGIFFLGRGNPSVVRSSLR